MNGVDMVRLIGSLMLIVVLILAAAWWLQRTSMLKAAQGLHIKVLSSRQVGVRQQLLVIEVDGTRLLLGANARQLSLLHVLPASPPAATQPAIIASDQAQTQPVPMASNQTQALSDFPPALSGVLERR